MKEATPEDLAYILNQNRKNGDPRAIFLTGAGVSVSSGIPSAAELAYEIQERYADNPRIARLKENERNYQALISCLTPGDRSRFLQEYVSKAKVNVSHVYLAHFASLGYVDYTLTTNFDNLALRAMSLFGLFPQVYDIMVLQGMSNTSLHTGSVIFLHGQHHNPFMLYAEEERAQLEYVVSPLFNKITNGRPWVVVGYSAADPVFECLIKLGRFDNGLYWVSDGFNDPPEHVRQLLLEKDANAFLIRGYDADAFFLRLNIAMGNAEPAVFDKPFSFLQSIQENIIDMPGSDMIGERYEIGRKFVRDAISHYEFNHHDAEPAERLKPKDIQDEHMRLELINAYMKKDYRHLEDIEGRINPKSNPWFSEMLSEIYNNRAVDACNHLETQKDMDADDDYLQAFTYFEKAVKLNPANDLAYHNWGTALYRYATTMDEEESETYLQDSYNKFAKAIEINLQKKTIYNNWGAAVHRAPKRR